MNTTAGPLAHAARESAPAATPTLRVEVDAGASIEMRLFAPPAAPPADAAAHGAVLIGGAMGVRQAFYRPFAETMREQFESVRFPLVALSISDDELMTERGTRVLVDCYANAPRRVERIAPADVAVRRIGHFGFFRDAFETTLWARAAGWLSEFRLAEETT